MDRTGYNLSLYDTYQKGQFLRYQSLAQKFNSFGVVHLIVRYHSLLHYCQDNSFQLCYLDRGPFRLSVWIDIVSNPLQNETKLHLSNIFIDSIWFINTCCIVSNQLYMAMLYTSLATKYPMYYAYIFQYLSRYQRIDMSRIYHGNRLSSATVVCRLIS